MSGEIVTAQRTLFGKPIRLVTRMHCRLCGRLVATYVAPEDKRRCVVRHRDPFAPGFWCDGSNVPAVSA